MCVAGFEQRISLPTRQTLRLFVPCCPGGDAVIVEKISLHNTGHDLTGTLIMNTDFFLSIFYKLKEFLKIILFYILSYTLIC